AAAAGQSAGKVLIFFGTRGAVRSAWLQRRLSRRAHVPRGQAATMLARLVDVLDRPRQATGLLLVSAIVGVPPLLAVSVYLGRTTMHPAVFAATCFVGRSVRFATIALAPHLAGY